MCCSVHLCAVFLISQSRERLVTSILPPLFSAWLCDPPFLQVIFPWIRKTINPIKTLRDGGREEGDLRGNLSRSCWALPEKEKEQSRGPAYISLSSNSFMSSETRVTVPLLYFRKLSRALCEGKQWEHFGKSYKGNGRVEEERKSEWHHW